MVNLPTIDIIIPNYNKGKYLEECLNSVISQTFKKWKIYLVDDNSTDNSKEILKKYQDHENIEIIYLKENRGPSYCRNLAIKNTNSEYIAFLDSDDYWPKDKLQIQITTMIKNDYSFTYTDLKFFMNNEKNKTFFAQLPEKFDYNKFILSSTMSTSSVVVKKKILKNIIFKNVKHEDYLFKCEILKTGIIASKINETFVFYRINKDNRSSNKFSNLYNLWNINKKYNNLKLLMNFKSILKISINSIRTYGWK